MRGFKIFVVKKRKMLKKYTISHKNKTELFIKLFIFIELFYKKNINI